MKDMIDVPKKVRDDLKIIPVTHMDQVLDIALSPAVEKPARPKRTRSKSKADETNTEEKSSND
jgi:ATP-dependent Lon protease